MEHHSIQLCNSLIDNSITETETESEEIDSPEVERPREDLLDGIDEDSDLCTSIHDLDSFMKSFEEEITTSPTSSHGSGVAEERIIESASDCGESGEVEEGIVELVSDSGELRPDLGYLLEASDDELGIPPPAASPARKELVTGVSLKYVVTTEWNTVVAALIDLLKLSKNFLDLYLESTGLNAMSEVIMNEQITRLLDLPWKTTQTTNDSAVFLMRHGDNQLAPQRSLLPRRFLALRLNRLRRAVETALVGEILRRFRRILLLELDDDRFNDVGIAVVDESDEGDLFGSSLRVDLLLLIVEIC
ncbi:hypothetical protein SASPL_133322 [Salvia splendens]|uniref:Uncharacterized protein n=1 Tax=Salvia splendens TaxID=180675 RepID=A0A8X8X2T8_SALSN|nr:hypothetical protein SASPL_133322 [Salvia splendens]